MIRQHLPAPSDESLIGVAGPSEMMYTLAGPTGTTPEDREGELQGSLRKMGYSPSQVHKFFDYYRDVVPDQ